MFAVLMLKPTYVILDWTIQKIRNIEIKARKVLTVTGNFHIISEVDCLYIPLSEGGRGFKAIQTAYKCEFLNHHLTRNKDKNQLFSNVCQSK